MHIIFLNKMVLWTIYHYFAIFDHKIYKMHCAQSGEYKIYMVSNINYFALDHGKFYAWGPITPTKGANLFLFIERQRMLLLKLFLNIGNYIFKCHSTVKTAYLLAKKNPLLFFLRSAQSTRWHNKTWCTTVTQNFSKQTGPS